MRRRYRFTGRVQGVGFRATARHVASDFPVTGWVRNEPDKSVVVEAQGQPADIDRFIEELRRVMSRNITGVGSEQLSDREGETTFSIQY